MIPLPCTPAIEAAQANVQAGFIILAQEQKGKNKSVRLKKKEKKKARDLQN